MPAALSARAGISVFGSSTKAGSVLAITGSVVGGAAGVSVMAAVRELYISALVSRDEVMSILYVGYLAQNLERTHEHQPE